MRCHRHPDRIADTPCSVCGRYHCTDCLSKVGGHGVCADCRPALEASRPIRPTTEGTREPRWRTGWVRVAVGLGVAAILAALLVVLAQRGGGGRESARVAPVLAAEEFDARMAASVQALERAAIAIETYRAERTRYPSGWADLVPDLVPESPADPWARDGAPLRLLAPPWDEAAILLYSVGPDGMDDGGRAYSADTGVGDVVYVVR